MSGYTYVGDSQIRARVTAWLLQTDAVDIRLGLWVTALAELQRSSTQRIVALPTAHCPLLGIHQHIRFELLGQV